MMIYELRDLLKRNTQANIDGQWVPARPTRLAGVAGLIDRIKGAWAVLTDKADAVRWPESQ
ncbi:hypothetical protein [Adonisia turfae]|nr:hypothetical protein [Adonisia turfae]